MHLNKYFLFTMLMTPAILSLAQTNDPPAWQLPTSIIRNPFQPPALSHATTTLPSLQLSTLKIHYGDAIKLAEVFNRKSSALLSAQGEIHANADTNQLWLYDYPRNIRLITQVIRQLDQPNSEILIKARVVNVDQQYARSLGIMLQTHPQLSNEKNSTAPNENNNKPDWTFTFPLARFSNEHLLDLQLQALVKQGHAKMIAAPQLITLNNKPALIESGDEIPYQEKSGQGNTSVAFKKAVLSLKVTPQTLPNNKILLQLQVNQDTLSALRVNGVPAIRTQELKTQVAVHNNETFVLGGIYEQIQSAQEQGIPGLHRLPLLGALFRHNHDVRSRKELLVFVTPQVIHN